MTDQVTNVEIEDVLSSIRKLVLDADQAKDPQAEAMSNGSADQMPEDVKVEKVEQKSAETPLVLTNSLRIMEDEPPLQQAPAEDEIDIDQSTDHAADEPLVLSTENVVAEQPDDIGVEILAADAPAQVSEPEMLSEEIQFDPVSLEDKIDPEQPQPTATEITETQFDLSCEDQVVQFSKVEKIIAARDLDWSADGAPGTENAALPDAPIKWQDDSSSQTIDHNDIEAIPEEDSAREAEEAAAAETVVEDLEKTEAQTTAQPEAPEASDTLTIEHHVDEEELTQLIVQIMQDQLQGTFGERITSNVRKLVRSEIHRALATRELE